MCRKSRPRMEGGYGGCLHWEMAGVMVEDTGRLRMLEGQGELVGRRIWRTGRALKQTHGYLEGYFVPGTRQCRQ